MSLLLVLQLALLPWAEPPGLHLHAYSYNLLYDVLLSMCESDRLTT